jgi:hypothetical protein
LSTPSALVNQTSPVAGAQIAPATGTPLSIRPILTVKLGSPRTKALVPSTGSTRKKRGPIASGVPNSLACSSEIAGISGKALGQPGQDQPLAGPVGLGHRALVGLADHVQLGAPERQDDLGGRLDDRRQVAAPRGESARFASHSGHQLRFVWF